MRSAQLYRAGGSYALSASHANRRLLLRTRASITSSSTQQASSQKLMAQSSMMQGFMQRVRECNVGLEELTTLTPFMVAGQTLGHLKPKYGWSHSNSVAHTVLQSV